MAAHLTVKGEFDTSLFTTGVNKVKGELNGLSKQANKSNGAMKSTANGGMMAMIKKGGKIAGVIAAAKGAFEVFDSIMNSSRSTLIEWTSTCEGAKTALDNFYRSVATGDWTAFEDGMINAINLSKEYQKQILLAKKAAGLGKMKADRLESERDMIEGRIQNAKTEKEVRELQKQYHNKFNLEKQVRGETVLQMGDPLTAFKEMNGIKGNVDVKTLRSWVEDYNRPGSLQYNDLLGYKNNVLPLKEDYEKYKDMRSGDRSTWSSEKIKEVDEKYYRARDLYESVLDKNLETVNRFVEGLTEKNEEEIKNTIDSVIEQQGKIGQMDMQIKQIDNDVENRIKELKEGDKKKITTHSSYDHVKPVQLDTKAIAIDIPLQIPETTLSLLEAGRHEIVKRMNTANQKDYIELKVKLAEQEELISTFKEGGDLDAVQLNLPDIKPALKEWADETEKTTKKMQSDFEKTQTKIDDTSTIVQSFGSIFSALGSAVGGTNGEMLNFFGTSMNGISQMIPQIMSLIGAKQGEAMASGTASAAKLPFPANIAAIASIIATIASIFASIPKHANGGIIQGATTIGDYNLARVNGGEMILNSRQQSRLFKMLNGNHIGSLNGMNIERQWRIEGSSLVGVIKNYNAIQNKLGKKTF